MSAVICGLVPEGADEPVEPPDGAPEVASDRNAINSSTASSSASIRSEALMGSSVTVPDADNDVPGAFAVRDCTVSVDPFSAAVALARIVCEPACRVTPSRRIARTDAMVKDVLSLAGAGPLVRRSGLRRKRNERPTSTWLRRTMISASSTRRRSSPARPAEICSSPIAKLLRLTDADVLEPQPHSRIPCDFKRPDRHGCAEHASRLGFEAGFDPLRCDERANQHDTATGSRGAQRRPMLSTSKGSSTCAELSHRWRRRATVSG